MKYDIREPCYGRFHLSKKTIYLILGIRTFAKEFPFSKIFYILGCRSWGEREVGASLGEVPHRQQDRRYQRGGGRRHLPRQQGRRLHQRHRPEGEVEIKNKAKKHH